MFDSRYRAILTLPSDRSLSTASQRVPTAAKRTSALNLHAISNVSLLPFCGACTDFSVIAATDINGVISLVWADPQASTKIRNTPLRSTLVLLRCHN